MQCRKLSGLLFLVCHIASVYKTGRGILIYKKYAHNSGQSNSDLFINHIQAKIRNVPIIGLNLFAHQGNVVMQLTRRNPE